MLGLLLTLYSVSLTLPILFFALSLHPPIPPSPFPVFGVWQPEPMNTLEWGAPFIFPAPQKPGACSPSLSRPAPTVPSSEILLSLQRFLMKCPANLLPSLYLQVDRDGFWDMRSLLPSESWGRNGWALQGANFQSSWAHRPTHCFLWPSV